MRLKRFTYRYLIMLGVLLLSASSIRSAHLVGGELFYECLGGNMYKITMKIYRDCGGVGAPFDPLAKVGIFERSTGNQVTLMQMAFPGSNQVPINDGSGCYTLPPNLCLEEAIYIDSIMLPPLAGGYDIVYQRCCRNPTIVNLDNPGAAGSTYTSFIPGDDTFCNSSPSFNNFPPVVICINDPLNFDHSATDLDGDSLVYEFARPYHGGTSANPAPNPVAPPFANTVWAPGFSDTYQLATAPAIALDPATGLLTGTPSAVGQYVVCIVVKEFRDGVFISETRRDFQFNVVNCNKAIAAIADQEVFCNDLTVQFDNNSFNSASFTWDFGDPTTLADTSNQLTPSYTYPDTGVYTIRLIASNGGGACSDTAYNSFRVFPRLEADFNPPANACIAGNSFTFNGAGFQYSSTDISWDFGPDATPQTSNNLNPSGISYSTPGSKNVRLVYSDFGCIDTAEALVEVYESPVADFSNDTNIVCARYPVSFTNLSVIDANNTYLWNFGDGTTSTARNPVHEYQFLGLYDVKLVATSNDGCKDSITYADLIQVKPSPTAGFSPLQAELFSSESEITFYNESSGGVTQLIFTTGDTALYTTFGDITHEYGAVGTYTTRQIVENAEGCSDTLYGTVIVKPDDFVYVPNSFTPNGDRYNETFKPSITYGEGYSFKVFDRWGGIVFETTEIEEAWDGTINGKKLAPTDVYVYTLSYKNADGDDKFYHGHVTLIR